MDFSYITELGLVWPDGRVERKNTDHIQIHHTVGDYGTPARFRALHEKRIREQGYKGVEYSFLVLEDGTVYEGRGLVFAHGGVKDAITNNANQRSVAIAFNGDMREEGQPTEAALQSAVRLINDIRAVYGLPVSAVLGHNEVPLYADGRPTGETYPTLCPCMDMDALRKRVSEAAGAEQPSAPEEGNSELPAAYTYAGDSYVNLRTAPQTGRIIGRVSRGEEVIVLQEQENWAEVIRHKDDPMQRGWCLASYFKRV